MSLTFDSNYFIGGVGYHIYQDFPHFAIRAMWLANFMSTNGYDHVTILGPGYGYLIKHLVETHGFDTSNVLGIENSTHAISQADALGYGVTQGYMVNSDIRTHNYAATDLVISWNVLDCFANLAEVQTVLSRLSDAEICFVAVYCASEDPMNSQFNEQNYFLAPFFDVFSALNLKKQSDDTYLVRYHDGYVYRISWSPSKLGTSYTGLSIPTCWGRVSD